jgi:hypothetical protein
VAKAFERVYLEHKDAIIACFKNVGLSLLIDSSECEGLSRVKRLRTWA